MYFLTKENYINRQMNKCVFKIMHMQFPQNKGFWVMGITFFHNYYTVFDVDNLRVGIAKSVLSPLKNSIVSLNEKLSNS